MLTFCRSTSFAYFSKDKNEKTRRRRLNFLKYTHLQRNQEATITLLTSLVKQPPTSVSPFVCILGSCYFKGRSEFSVWRTCPEIFQSLQGWPPCHSSGAAGGEVLHSPSSQGRRPGFLAAWRQREQESPKRAHTRVHTHAHAHTYMHTHAHPQNLAPSHMQMS